MPAAVTAGYPHYRNDGSGRDTYVNDASAVMSLTGKVAPSQAARDSIEFWKSPLRPLSHDLGESRRTFSSSSSHNASLSSSSLRVALPPNLATSPLVHRNDLNASYQGRLLPLAPRVGDIVPPSAVGGSRPFSALMYESSSHRSLRLGRTGPVETFQPKYVHALPTVARRQ